MNSEKPLHIALIPDGNRRWASAHKLQPWKGHEKSQEGMRTIMEWCREDPRVSTLTIWCFSTENWKRDPKEVEHLMKMMEKSLTKERETFHKNTTRLLHSGRMDRLTPSLHQLLQDIAADTAQYDQLTVNFALDYGGKDELLRAISKIENKHDITDATIREQLDHPELPDIDLVIRTSGETRTSNFNLWQTTYAEWIFHPKLFPDFTAKDFADCVDEFSKRARRFGS